jgi:hypothetical protein
VFDRPIRRLAHDAWRTNVLDRAIRGWRWFGYRARLLFGIWALFAVLVGSRIHGSSIALVAKHWAGDYSTQQHFLLSAVLDELTPAAARRYREVLMAKPRVIRWDEWAHTTPAALSQFTHHPRHPVVNTNFGSGQNMLLIPWVPVLHPSMVARPVSWGYLLLGQRRGLAWSWWFPPFFCVTALLLLFEIVFPGRRLVQAIGALWFTGSAYVVCWSHWPASYVGFGALTCVTLYWCLSVRGPIRRGAAGVALGLSAAGFAMHLYPPWLIPLTYTFLAVVVGLVLRDRLGPAFLQRKTILATGLGVVIGCACLGSFLVSTSDALAAMADTVYPGQRRLQGGDCGFPRLFGGFYNALTIRRRTSELDNESEAAGFFLFFPVVVAVLAISPALRRRFDPLAWILLWLGGALFVYCHFGFPQFLASALLLDRVQGFRAQIALGFISIVLSLYLMVHGREALSGPESRKRSLQVFALAGAFYAWQGFELLWTTQIFRGSNVGLLLVVGVSLTAAFMSLLLAQGKVRLFGGFLAGGLLATSGTFNPLYISFPTLEGSELRRAIRAIVESDRAKGKTASFLVYGQGVSPNHGTLASMMGARTSAGVHLHPNTALWAQLDPRGEARNTYNRYAVVSHRQEPLDVEDLKVNLLEDVQVEIAASPRHPWLRAAGARYAITFGKSSVIQRSDFKLLYWSEDQRSFAIWDLEPPSGNDARAEDAVTVAESDEDDVGAEQAILPNVRPQPRRRRHDRASSNHTAPGLRRPRSPRGSMPPRNDVTPDDPFAAQRKVR